MTEARDTTTEHARAVLQSGIEIRGVAFERRDAWQRIEEHVGTHKYLLDLRSRDEVAWSEAALSWQNSVMNPLLEAVERQVATEAFPERAVGDLLIELSDHWYFLKQERPVVTPDEAVVSFTRRFGTNVGSWHARNILRRVTRAIREGWHRGVEIDDRVRATREAAIRTETVL